MNIIKKYFLLKENNKKPIIYRDDLFERFYKPYKDLNEDEKRCIFILNNLGTIKRGCLVYYFKKYKKDFKLVKQISKKLLYSNRFIKRLKKDIRSSYNIDKYPEENYKVETALIHGKYDTYIELMKRKLHYSYSLGWLLEDSKITEDKNENL